jgi:hypothetical protein
MARLQARFGTSTKFTNRRRVLKWVEMKPQSLRRRPKVKMSDITTIISTHSSLTTYHSPAPSHLVHSTFCTDTSNNMIITDPCLIIVCGDREIIPTSIPSVEITDWLLSSVAIKRVLIRSTSKYWQVGDSGTVPYSYKATSPSRFHHSLGLLPLGYRDEQAA